jgi:hypothetical protein
MLYLPRHRFVDHAFCTSAFGILVNFNADRLQQLARTSMRISLSLSGT